MAKKTRKEKAAEQAIQQEVVSTIIPKPSSDSSRSVRRLHLIFLFILALVFYGNTLNNDFALDDSLAILGNSFTTQGFAGIDDIWTHDMFVGAHGQEFELTGGRYRPLSFTILAVEYEFFGDYVDERGIKSHMAFVGHLTNVLLFAFSGIMIYLLLLKIFRNFNEWLPLIAATLFVIHPIHTEVVANIKSMDEILSLLFLMISIYFMLDKGQKPMIFSAFFYLLSLLSKENTFTALAIIPVLYVFFRKEELKSGIMKTGALLGVAIVYLTLREIYSGGFFGGHAAKQLMDNPFLGMGMDVKLPTLFVIAGKYLTLSVFPYPLSYDYSYDALGWRTWGDIYAILSFAVIAAALGFASKVFWAKYKEEEITQPNIISVIAFGILFYAIAYSIVSNFVFNIGTYMGERFLYMASLGFCIAVAGLIIKLLKIDTSSPFQFNVKWALPMLVLIPIAGYATINRNVEWKDNYSLYMADREVVPNSARARLFLGIELLNQHYVDKDFEKLEMSIEEITKSTNIYPEFYHAHYNLGLAYQAKQDHENALKCFNRVLEIQPYHINTHYYLGMSLGHGFNKPLQAIEYMEKGIKYGYAGLDRYVNLGVAYGMTANFTKALECFNKAKIEDPSNAQVYVNMGITYSQMGDKQKAKEAMQKAKQLDSSLAMSGNLPSSSLLFVSSSLLYSFTIFTPNLSFASPLLYMIYLFVSVVD
ncbi:MAG: tetratricopeptide repeat protein [Flavobacteriales bacterium]|nr:tetratricopeptide repeat protein [Flavobacteriales bacterium]